MSPFDPRMIRVHVAYDPWFREPAAYLMCLKCDPAGNPESIKVYRAEPGPSLDDMGDRARDHWRKWHASE